jgi:hypothetical protein
MSELINLATFRARKAAQKADRHVARVIFQFDHEIAFGDMNVMMEALRTAGRDDIADEIFDRAIVVTP